MKVGRLILMIAMAFGVVTTTYAEESIKVGAERTDLYFDLLRGERVALFSNHSGMVGDKHTLDLLIEDGLDVVAIFSPEHGFRGSADAGEHISNSVDPKSGVPILSLYDGNSKSPSKSSMDKFDTLVVDIQDVGLRFYTYYISVYYLMDACAKEGKQMIILDRPNPNGHYVDGPILDLKYKSGIGVIPIPVVHGMTIGELAQMINGEGWLSEHRVCPLEVVPCENYTHQSMYHLPIAPSPNLPNMKSIYAYPSMCLLEGTPVSVGRGTDTPFLVYGHPDMKGCSFSFTPRSRVGALKPPFMNRECQGVDLNSVSDEALWQQGVSLEYVIDAYNKLSVGGNFFGQLFELLIGQRYVRDMIIEGHSAKQIEAMWRGDVESFMEQRRPYLIYEE